MEKSDYKIHIIGAGLSGLITAQILENHGYAPVILEATDAVGGRVKTEIVEGYQVDHGFQVLLQAYPKAQEYLHFESLQLQPLQPGAVIFLNGKKKVIGDPLRDLSLLLPTLFSGMGTLADKIKIFQLNRTLKKTSVEAIFTSEETTTLQFLQKKGFSEEIIATFFKPFFSGIFLEDELQTSSRMFQFVYKMFGEGLAVIPKNGIGALTTYLAEQLKNTTLLLNSPVEEVIDGTITLKNGEKRASHITIIATEASALVPNLKNQEIAWKSCHTFYFEVERRSIEKPLIGLIADAEAHVNNLFYHNSIATATKGTKELLSVTVVKKTELSVPELSKKVQQELEQYCNITNTRFLKHFYIKKALPDIMQLQYQLSPTETQLTSTIFLAGDHLLNGSQNAAILSGERAALGVIKTLQGGSITGTLTSEYR